MFWQLSVLVQGDEIGKRFHFLNVYIFVLSQKPAHFKIKNGCRILIEFPNNELTRITGRWRYVRVMQAKPSLSFPIIHFNGHWETRSVEEWQLKRVILASCICSETQTITVWSNNVTPSRFYGYFIIFGGLQGRGEFRKFLKWGQIGGSDNPEVAHQRPNREKKMSGILWCFSDI